MRRLQPSTTPVVFPMEMWHSPVGNQNGLSAERNRMKLLEVEERDWEQTAAIIDRFFKVRAEDLA
jgi:hypothetical protein